MEASSLSALTLNDPNLVNTLIKHYDELDTCLHESSNALQLQSKLDYLLHFFTHNGRHIDQCPAASDQFDAYIVVFRNLLRNPQNVNIPYSIKLQLLRVVEFRAAKWRKKVPIEEYYSEKIPYIDMFPSPPVRPRSRRRNALRASKSAGDVSTMNNNAAARPLKALKKIQIEGEITIKNSESGRVMGVKGRRVRMIEQLSSTVISFQKVSPTSLNRIVHITGQSAESVEDAKNIIRNTIRDNVSPIPDDIFASRDSIDPSSEKTGSESAWSIDSNPNITQDPEYRFLVSVRCEEFTVSVNSSVIGRHLEQFLRDKNFEQYEQNLREELRVPRIVYDRETLLSLRDSTGIFSLPKLDVDREFLKAEE